MNYDEAARKGGETSIREADRFFAGTSAVHVSLKKVAALLEQLEIPYAVCGAMGDVQEFIKRVGVSREISSEISPAGRAKFEEFWDLIAAMPRELW